MSSRWLVAIAVALICFVVGFSASLVLHWSIRPESTTAQQQVAQAQLQAVADLQLETNDLAEQNSDLKAVVANLETSLSHAVEIQNVNEGRARALVNELQEYRQERNRFFDRLELRKQKLLDKISQLDATITEQIEQRDQNETDINDYELAGTLTSYLSYPHALNDQVSLNTALIEQPKRNARFVEQRFQLMLQLEDYDYTDQVYASLNTLHEQLNKQNKNKTTTLWVHCTANACEVQVELTVVEPFFDYTQQWLNSLSDSTKTKGLVQFFETHDGKTVVIAAIIERLKK